MNQPPQTGKRIVSKKTYVNAQIKKATLGSVSILLLGSAVGLAVVTLGVMGLVSARILLLPIAILGWSTSLFVGYMGIRAVNRLEEIDPGVPLTRANTAHLSALDSLVRASEEPVQEQQAVLLRAATQTQERHEEQLVRASAGGAERT
jgi:hypothetical protein